MDHRSISIRWPRVPEPIEIIAWLLALPQHLRAYWSQPRVQLLWGIAFLGAVLRLTQPSLAPLGSREVAYLAQAERLLGGVQSPIGAEAAPLRDASGMGYFLTLPMLLGRDPKWLILFFGALNALAIILLFGLARRFFSLRCAIISGLLLATSPWAVLLGRRIAPEALLIPLGGALLAALYSGIRDANPWAWTLSCLLTGIALSLSFSAWPLALALLIVSALFWRHIRWPYVTLGILILLLATAHALYEGQRTHPEGLVGLWRQAMQASSAATPYEPSLLAGLYGGQQLERLAAPSEAAFALDGALISRTQHLMSGLWALSLPGTLWLAILSWSRWRDGQDSGRHLLIAAWNLTLFVAWAALRVPAAPEKMAYMLPGGFLGIGVLFDRFLDAPQSKLLRRHRWAWGAYLAVWGMLAVCTAWNLYAVSYVSRFVVERDAHSGYGMPYRYWERMAQAVVREAQTADADQAWIASGGDAAWQAEQAAVLPYLLDPEIKSIIMLQQPGGVLLPAERPAVYLLVGSAPWAEGITAYLGGQDAGIVFLPEGQGEARIRPVHRQSVEEMLALAPVRLLRSFDAGMHLVGYEWPANARGGARVTVGTYWAFWDVPPMESEWSHRLTIALVDSAGRRMAGAQGWALPSKYWGDDLLLKQWHTLDLSQTPPGDYILAIVLERIDGAMSLHVDERGMPLGNAIALGPVHVDQAELASSAP